jgi:hypothetical protein
MDDAVIGYLSSAAAARAPRVYEDAQLVESLLNDICGPDIYRREISALANAVQARIPLALLAASHGVPPTLGDRLTRRLTDRAIDDEAARWAVQGWATVLGVGRLRFSPLPAQRSASAAIHQAFAQADASVARIAGAATRVAVSLPVRLEARAVGLAIAASCVTATDADLAARLLEEAEAAIKSVTRQHLRKSQLHAISIALQTARPRDAERLARDIDGVLRDHALASLAEALGESGAYDPAMRAAWDIADQPMRMHTLTWLAVAVADLDSDRAMRLVRRLGDDYWTAEALCGVAEVIAIDDPPTAATLVAEAEARARAIGDEATSASALGRVARSLARQDRERATAVFDEAERLARSVDEATSASALGGLAIALTESDPDRALNIAAALPDNWYAMGEIAKIIARSQPERALPLAQSIAPQSPHLADIAAVLADTDPDGALLLAQSIRSARCKAEALAAIARALARTDANRAAGLLDDMEQSAMGLPDSLEKVATLADIAGAWAASAAARGPV